MTALPTPDVPAPPVAAPLLEVDGVSRHFEVRDGLQRRRAVLRAVQDVSLSLAPGETLGVVGESGCGKSTLARVMLGLIKPTAGTISFHGTPITRRNRAALRAKAQMIFQDPYSSLDPRRTVGHSIEEPLRVHTSWSARDRHAAAARTLASVGIGAEALRRFPHEFSGGQLQRVGIARAMVVSPELLVCDEPVSALDVSVQSQVLNLFRQLQAEHGLSYLFVSHDIGVIRFVSHRVAVMYLGRVVETAPRHEFFTNTRHPYSRALLGAVPSIRRTGAPQQVLAGELPSPLRPPPGCPFQTRCPSVMDVCRVEMPPLRQVGPDHASACHLDAPPPEAGARPTASPVGAG